MTANHGGSTSQTSSHATVASPFADARHLYLLGVGLLLGILLGPAVLGRVAPETYAAWFTGAGEAAAEIRAFNEDTAEGLERLIATGVSDIAIDEYIAERDAERQFLPAFGRAVIEQNQHEKAWAGRLLALVLTVVVVMGLEAWVGPTPRDGRAVVPPALGRLVTIRYALIALWLMLALASPAALLGAPWVFFAMVLLVVMVVGLVPLGKNQTITEDTMRS